MQRISNDAHRYDDLLHLAHPEPHTRPRMSRLDRAAQFSPFAALTGHSEAMEETARLTDRKIEPGEIQLAELNKTLFAIRQHLTERPYVRVTFFVPDARKDGGEYRTVCGQVRYIAEAEQFVELTDGTRIPIEDILILDQSHLSNTHSNS